MRDSESFDCVEMKNAIQAQLPKEYEGLDEREIVRHRRQWLETSDSPVAKWWRTMQTARQSP